MEGHGGVEEQGASEGRGRTEGGVDLFYTYPPCTVRNFSVYTQETL